MTTEKRFKISVVIPTYNMGETIGETVKSILNQTYKNFEIVIQDNCSSDNTREIVKEFSKKPIRFFRNKENLGYAKNLTEGIKNARGDIVFLLGADDILSTDALQRTNNAFGISHNIGAVTRPYYWFQEKIDSPIRITPILDENSDEIVYIKDISRAARVLHNEILGQLSGLAFRKEYLKSNFLTAENDWIAHGYPFVNIFKEHPVVFLKDFQVAIRIGENNVRQKGSDLYRISPTKRWVEMLDELLSEKKFSNLKSHYLKNTIGANFVGLVQIRCYSSFKHVIREIYYLLKLNWLNIFNIKFWFFSLGCIFIPSSILAGIVDYYKNKVNSKMIGKLNFEYSLA